MPFKRASFCSSASRMAFSAALCAAAEAPGCKPAGLGWFVPHRVRNDARRFETSIVCSLATPPNPCKQCSMTQSRPCAMLRIRLRSADQVCEHGFA